MPPPWSGGERQPDAELNWTGALRKANLADRVIQFDQPGLLNLRMGGPDSQRGISLCRKLELVLRWQKRKPEYATRQSKSMSSGKDRQLTCTLPLFRADEYTCLFFRIA